MEGIIIIALFMVFLIVISLIIDRPSKVERMIEQSDSFESNPYNTREQEYQDKIEALFNYVEELERGQSKSIIVCSFCKNEKEDGCGCGAKKWVEIVLKRKYI